MSLRTKRKGKQDGVRRFQCNECGKKFRSNRSNKKIAEVLWKEYSIGKQTLAEIAKNVGRSYRWVRNRLDDVEVTMLDDLMPQPTVLVPDTTFWGRGYGVCVFRSWTLKRNLWWSEVASEKVANYYYGRKILEDAGWTFTAAVVDGRRGLATVFKDIPVQICHFHQLQTVTKYLTKRPKTEAGVELRRLALTLAHTDRQTFTGALVAWEKRWHHFYTEKTCVTGTKHWYYTHKNVRSAYYSLYRNLPHLFTYQHYPELNIPNTTNTIDGYFASVKKKVAAHHGLRRDRRYKLICQLLKSG
jgi:hypothetical protein